MFITVDAMKSEYPLAREICMAICSFYGRENTRYFNKTTRAESPHPNDVTNGLTALLDAHDFLKTSIDVNNHLKEKEGNIAVMLESPLSLHVKYAGLPAENLKSEIFYHLLPRYEDLHQLESPDVAILLDCVNPRTDEEKAEMESYRSVASVIAGGLAYKNLVREFESNQTEMTARKYIGIAHPTSRKVLYGSVIHVPYEQGERVEKIMPRIIQALKSEAITGKHLVDIPLDLLGTAGDSSYINTDAENDFAYDIESKQED